jgi:hypothetical protein
MIETELGSCLTIVFLNKSHESPTPTVWVCTNRAVYESSLRHLQGLKHVEVVQAGPSHVQEGNPGRRLATPDKVIEFLDRFNTEPV